MPIEGKVITALGSFFKNNFSFSNNFIIENLIKKRSFMASRSFCVLTLQL